MGLGSTHSWYRTSSATTIQHIECARSCWMVRDNHWTGELPICRDGCASFSMFQLRGEDSFQWQKQEPVDEYELPSWQPGNGKSFFLNRKPWEISHTWWIFRCQVFLPERRMIPMPFDGNLEAKDNLILMIDSFWRERERDWFILILENHLIVSRQGFVLIHWHFIQKQRCIGPSLQWLVIYSPWYTQLFLGLVFARDDQDFLGPPFRSPIGESTTCKLKEQMSNEIHGLAVPSCNIREAMDSCCGVGGLHQEHTFIEFIWTTTLLFYQCTWQCTEKKGRCCPNSCRWSSL